MPPARGRGQGARGKQVARGSPKGRKAAQLPPSAASASKKVDQKEAEETADVPVTEETPMEEDPIVEGSVETTSESGKADVDLPATGAKGDGNSAAHQPNQEPESSVKGKDENLHTEGEKAQTEEKDKGLQSEGDKVQADNNPDGDEEMAEKTTADDTSDSDCYWRVRVCPVYFSDFCGLSNGFQQIMKMTQSFEFRMSQLLLTKMARNWDRTSVENNRPWLPGNEKAFKSCTNELGLMEMKVKDKSLVKLIQSIRDLKLSRKDRVRIELKRISKQKALCSKLRPDAEEPEDKDKVETSSPFEDLKVNFCFRLQYDSTPAFSHKPDHVKTEQDDYIFVKKISDLVPDNVLEAIFLTDMVERNTGTAVFKAPANANAQGFMEQYEGVLVNFEFLEMSTTLSTWKEAKQKHAIAAVEWQRKNKRHAGTSPQGASAAKKSRGVSQSPRGGARNDVRRPLHPGGRQQQAARGSAQGRGNNNWQGQPGQMGDPPHRPQHIPSLMAFPVPLGHQSSSTFLEGMQAEVLATQRELQAKIARLQLLEAQNQTVSNFQGGAMDYPARQGGPPARYFYNQQRSSTNEQQQGNRNNRSRNRARWNRPNKNQAGRQQK